MRHLLSLLLLLPSLAEAEMPDDLFRQLLTVKKCSAGKDGKVACRFDTGKVDFTVVTGENPNSLAFSVDKVEKGWRVGLVGKCLMVIALDGPARGAVSAWSGEVFHSDNQLADCINHG
jgi:hypothetical protein